MKHLVLPSVMTLACGLAWSAPPIVSSHADGATPRVMFRPGDGLVQGSVLYSQMGTDSGIGTVSQNFEPAYDVYDSQAADDFTLPSNAKITEIDVVGSYFNGAGPVDSFNVTFYKNSKGRPGKVIASHQGLAYQELGGMTKIPVPSTLAKCCVTWTSVQANMDFGGGGGGQVAGGTGEWAWENQTTVVGAPAMWQNPGDGFGTGCTTWQAEATCTGSGAGDHMFTIIGKLKGKTR